MKKVKLGAVPLYIVMLIPLIVYGKLFDTGMEKFPWFPDNAETLDLFLYYKKNMIIAASVIILLFAASGLIWKKYAISRTVGKRLLVFWPFAMYVALVFLSSAVSPYRKYAFRGMMEQFESVWVAVGYFLICCYAYLACYENFFVVFGGILGIVGAIGTLQLFGVDIYRMELFQKLCMPQSLQDIPFRITTGRGRSYCSLSNPNYVGMLCVLAIPILAVLAVCEKTRSKKMMYCISALLLFCSLIGSGSKSGIMVLAVCMVLVVFLLRREIAAGCRRRPKSAALFLVAAIGFIAVVILYKWEDLSQSVQSVINRDKKPATEISEISTGEDVVKIVYNGKVLLFGLDNQGDTLAHAIRITDENGKVYQTTEKDGILSFEDPRLSQFTASLARYGEYTALEIGDGQFYWYFTDQVEGHTWYYLTNYAKQDKLASSEIAIYKGLEGRETIASGRGYIWSRTIPLIKKYIALGSGQDSFAAVFPNNDYLGMAKWGYKDMIITKPHSMYLQIAIQSGLLSLIFLLIFWSCFFIKAVGTRPENPQYVLVKAIAIGIFGYLLMGFTNDSNVGVAPLFWLILGIGMRMGDGL